MAYPETTIKRFTNHFEKHINSICEIDDDSPHRDYKKILFLSVLDGISKPIYPQKQSNRQRIILLLKQFSEWQYGDRVSLPHLEKLLSRNPDPAYEKLRVPIRNLLIQWPHGQQITLEKDPYPNEINKLWPQDKDHRIPIEGVSLENLQHWNLIYSYRNSLVHSLQVPGYGLDDYGFDEPFYIRIGMDEKDYGPPAVYHLAYPIKHFETLCRITLKNVNKYLLTNNIEHIQFFTGGSYFIDELN